MTSFDPNLRTRPIRVLIVDDSGITRRLLAKALASDSNFLVVGSVASAEHALELLPSLRPDAMTLDIHMEGMSGLDLLPIVREQFRDIRVLLFTSSSESSASATINALLHGATGFMLKPFATDSTSNAFAAFSRNLRDNLRALFTRPALPKAQRVPPSPKPRVAPRVLAIGVSTGGPSALAHVLSDLPHNFPLPILIVQHMAPIFTRILAERLSTTTGHNVVEATDGIPVTPHRVYLAPGDFHMRLTQHGTLRLDQREHENSCRPSVDILFRSVADVCGPAAIAAVLTGMGRDGQRGATLLAHHGAMLIAQDQATSTVWGMPGAIAHLADHILPLHSIGPTINSYVASLTQTLRAA